MIKEAKNLVIIFWIISLVFFVLGCLYKIFYIFSALGAFSTLFLVYFFRDPERKIKIDDTILYSPADGKIFEITEDENFYCIKIFLSIFDVHIQRSPASGVVRRIEYKKGKFTLAGKATASILNEKNSIEIYIQAVNNFIRVTQIAGKLARRIICWVKQDMAIKQGQKIGAILLGSQVDLEIPKSNFKLLVFKNQKVYAGLTPVAILVK